MNQGQNTGLWLVHTDHVTWTLASDWSELSLSAPDSCEWCIHHYYGVMTSLSRHNTGLSLVLTNHVTWILASDWSTLSLFSASSQIKTHHRHRNSNQEPFYAPLKTFQSFFCTESFSIIRAGLRIKLSRKRSWIEMAERQNIIHTMEISGLTIVLIWGLECQWRLSLQVIIRWTDDTGLWLVATDHVTRILGSDWSSSGHTDRKFNSTTKVPRLWWNVCVI